MALTHEMLAAHAVGALEPGNALIVEEGLRTDVLAGFRLGGIEALAGVRKTSASQPLIAQARAADLLGGDDELSIGDRVSLRVGVPVSPDAARCVLFREAGTHVELIHPRPAAFWPTLDRFRAEGGARMLDLVLEPPGGLHRYELILVPADIYQEAWPADQEVWLELRDAYRRGRLPGAVFELDVRAA